MNGKSGNGDEDYSEEYDDVDNDDSDVKDDDDDLIAGAVEVKPRHRRPSGLVAGNQHHCTRSDSD